jgi:nucleoside-diphosphate-sugar epimerase
MGPLPIVIDVANNAAAIPGSGNVPVAFTHTTDVASFTAKLLNLEKWPRESYVVGEKLTWNEFLSLVERVKGVKFDVAYDGMEKLQRYQTTELPGQKELYPFFPKPMLQGLTAACGILFDKGFFDINSEENVVGIKARGIRELIAEAWGSS